MWKSLALVWAGSRSALHRARASRRRPVGITAQRGLRGRRLLFEGLENRRLLSLTGNVLPGTIGFAGERDLYEYWTGATAEVATLAVANTSQSSYVPTATLYRYRSSDGTRISEGSVSAGFKEWFPLNANTKYAVEMHDDNYRETGTYYFTMEGLKPASLDSRAITRIGERVESGTIDVGEIDEYTFTASPFDVVSLSLAKTDSGSYSPIAELYAPSGAKVKMYSAQNPSNSLDAKSGEKVVSRGLPETGTYVIQVFDNNYTHSGDYLLALEGVKPPSVDAAFARLGDVVGGSVAAGEVDEVYFQGAAGSWVTISLSKAESNPGAELWAELYSPSGVKVGGVGDDEVDDGNKRVFHLPAETGTYVVQVFDNNYTDAESYGVAVEGLNPISNDAISLPRNVWQAGSLSAMGEVDAYYFALSSTSQVTVELTADWTVPYKPYIGLYNSATGELYDEDRTLIYEALPAGTYVIQVFDNDYTHTGAYQVKWDAPAVPTVNFVPASQTIVEGATGSFQVQLSAAAAGAVTVPYTLGGTANSGTDYTISPNPVLIPAGSLSATVTITAISDGVPEAAETVIVTMGTPSGAVPGTATVHTATIQDGVPPTPTVSFTAASQSRLESAGSATVTVALSAPASQAVTVPYTVGGTATPGTDYTVPPSPVVIPAGSLTATIAVTIVNDTAPEPNETVVVTMGTPTGADRGPITVHTATIVDDDTPCVSFTAASQTVGENVGQATITVQLSKLAGSDVSVPFTVTGTATAGTDYTIAPSPVVIPAGSLTATITVTVAADTSSEPDETVIVTLGTPANANLCLSPMVHTLLIEDDQPNVSFTTAAQTVSEQIATVTVTARLSWAAGTSVSVPFTVGGTATPGADYALLTASPLVIPAGSLTGTISLTVVHDAVAEPNETAIVSMGTPSGAVPGATTVHTVTIVDAPLVCASFAGSFQVRRENQAAGPIIVQLSEAAGSSVAVPFTVSGTATSGTDYTISPSPVVIPAGSLTGQIAVTLIDDQVGEPTKQVNVVLANPASCPSALYVVYIYDDDVNLPSVEFAADAQSRPENVRTMTIEARLSAAATDPVSVTYALGGTAAPGTKADYTISPNPLVIPAGSLAASITVKVNNDKTYELDETVIVTMTSATNADLGGVTQHTATILDDEPPPKVSFTAKRQTLTEEAAEVRVTARLSAVPLRPVTVPFTLGGTAALGSDYVAPAGPLTIPAGSQEGTIVITVREDAIDEADETLIVTLGTPANAVLGGTKKHTITIRDDDPYPAVAFTAGSQSCLESAGTLAIAVQLSEVSGQEVQVPFRLSGTARKGATRDYTVAPGKLTIPAGSVGAEIVVTVNNDVLTESDETIIVTLRKPVRATLGAMAKHTLTIRDDDAAVPALAAASYVTAPAAAPQEAAATQEATAPAFSAPVPLLPAPQDVPAAAPGAAAVPVRRPPSSPEEAGPLDRDLEALLEEIVPALIPH